MLYKITAFILSAVLAFAVTMTPAYAAQSDTPPQTISESYVVMDAETGQVLIEKNMNVREYPASITKVFTVALALQNVGLGDKVTVTQDAAWSIEPNSSNIALQVGEVLTVEDLAYGAMLPSANDAANVLAEYAGGTMESFAAMMNAKAKELGCLSSNFVNASGLPDDNHYTTAYDMALITRYAMGVESFMPVFGMKDIYVIKPSNKQKYERRLGTEHMMLVESKYYYEGTIGGKLGWTEDAKHTIVTAAQRGGRTLICVAMKSPQKYDKFNDSIALFDYCFDNFESAVVTKDKLKTFNVSQYTGDAAGTLNIYGSESYPLMLHKSLSAADILIDYDVPEYYKDTPVTPKVRFSVNSDSMYTELGAYPMEYTPVEFSETEGAAEDIKVKMTLKERLLWLLKGLAIILLAAAAIIILLGIAAVCMRFINKRRRKKARRRAAHITVEARRSAGMRSAADPRGLSANSIPAEPKGYSVNRTLAEPKGTAANRARPYRPPQPPPPRRRR